MLDTRLSAAKERWLAELYEANSNIVLRMCWRLLSNPQDAADACQEVFLRAAKFLDPDLPRDQAKGWLLTVARNYCLDQLRRQKRISSSLSRVGLDGDRQEDPATSVVDRQFVSAIFKQLNERERTVLWQTAVEHRSLADVASHLRMNYMAAGQVVSRARRHASALAAKVAAVFVVFRFLGKRVGLLPAKLVAATAVPLIAITVQTSSSATSNVNLPSVQSTAPLKHSPIATPATGQGQPAGTPLLPGGPGASLPVGPPQVSPPPLPLPTSLAGTAGSAAGTLNSILHQLPTPPPVPTPTLPPPPGLK